MFPNFTMTSITLTAKPDRACTRPTCLMNRHKILNNTPTKWTQGLLCISIYAY